MTSCADLLDRMPEVAAGRTAWTAAEATHLGACAECQGDWKLIQRARQLGDRAEARVDPAVLAPRLQGRIDAARRGDRLRRAGWVAGLAFAAGIALLVWRGGGSQRSGTTSAPAFQIPVAELDSLDDRQLQTVLEALDEPVGSDISPEVPTFGELDNQQMERVLRSLEG